MTATGPQDRAISVKSPDAFRTISEVSEELNLPQHVLRFWETRFTQLRPMKRNGGRRLYRPDHVALLRGIKALLYQDGLTIRDVQKQLRDGGTRSVVARGASDASQPPTPPVDASERLAALRQRRTPAEPAASSEGRSARLLHCIHRLEDVLQRLQMR
jgi:DNA-binding transcriptional MerR regulator